MDKRKPLIRNLIACALAVTLLTASSSHASISLGGGSGMGYTVEAPVQMHADGFPWAYEIKVALPPSYGVSSNRYPVLWALDGNMDMALSVLQRPDLALPEMIVVSVGHPRESPELSVEQLQMRRVHELLLNPSHSRPYGPGLALYLPWKKENDANWKKIKMTGDAPLFLKFLVEKVRPVLQSKYRMSEDTTLWGHSGGGKFGLYAMFSNPGNFKHYILGSSAFAPNDPTYFELEENYARSHHDLPVSLFLGAGGSEALDGSALALWGSVSATARMAELLGLRHYPSLKLDFGVFNGKNHGTSAPTILQAGLMYIYKNKATSAGVDPG